MRWLLCILTVALHITPARATTLVGWDVATLTAASDAVVLATVGRPRHALEDGQPWTRTPLEVHEAWKGAPEAVTWVSQLGGPYGDGRTLTLAGDLVLEPGQTVVLFVVHDGERWIPTLLSWSGFVVQGAHVRHLAHDLEVLEAPPMPVTLSALHAQATP